MYSRLEATRPLEAIPNPNRPEDVLKVDADEDGIGGADAADAMRYLIDEVESGGAEKIGGGLGNSSYKPM